MGHGVTVVGEGVTASTVVLNICDVTDAELPSGACALLSHPLCSRRECAPTSAAFKIRPPFSNHAALAKDRHYQE